MIEEVKQNLRKLNKKQWQFLMSIAAVRLFLGGRGCGKSFALGMSILLHAIYLPQSKGGLVAKTYHQILTKTMDSVKAAWKTVGLIEGVHYVVGLKPPKHWNLPHNPPNSYKHFITFYWGSCVEMLSMERPDYIRGGSYDYFEIDEAGLLPQYTYTQILLPACRGNKDIYSSPYHHQISFYTSIPWKAHGNWILEYEQKAKKDPKKYCFVEANAYDNIKVLGEAGIQRMREEMGHLEFQVEVMNLRVNKTTNPFYGKFDTDKHTYTAKFEYKEKNGIMVSHAKDINADKFLEVSFDFGGGINCCTVWQFDGKVERCVREFYVKGKNTLKDLVRNVCLEFKDHRTKYVRVWGDPIGHNAQPGSESWFDLVQKHFDEEGWKSDVAVPKGYRAGFHETRQELINEMFEGTRADLPLVMFNEIECKNSIIVMQTTEVLSNGKKDKSNETKKETFPQELATHFSDTVDYYLTFKYLTKKRKSSRKRGVATA
jgi:Terminase large subunit, T4likevirus-type, N-terminal